jgi:hypothetical protein
MGSKGENIFDDEYWIPRGSSLMLSYIGPPVERIPEDKRLKSFLRRKKALAAMWNYDGDYADDGPWYRCICDVQGYDESSIKSGNVRHNLRRSLNRCTVREVDFPWLAENGYAVYAKASARFENYIRITESEYRTEMQTHAGHGERKAVGVFVGETLIAFATLILVADIVFGDTAYFDPDYSNAYPMYALYYSVAREYLAAGYRAFDRGSKPLLHETGIDPFLLRLGFRFSYCRLGLYLVFPLRMALDIADTLNRILPGLRIMQASKALAALASARAIAESTKPRADDRPLGQRGLEQQHNEA